MKRGHIIQSCFEEDVFDKSNLSLIRGKIISEDGDPVGGVFVYIPNKPEFGQTLTREDGAFEMLVKGGPAYILRFRKRTLQSRPKS